MSYQSELQRTLRRLHDRTLSNTSVRVLEPSVSYQPGAGPTVSHTEVAEVPARLEVPNRSTAQDEGGIAETADATVRVRDDAPQDSQTTIQWVEYDGGAAAHIIDTETGDRYEVRTKTREQNGLLRLTVELTDDNL